jgi:hypothetical protein
VHVCALKVSHEDVLEVCPRMDVVCGEMLEPCSGTFCEVERQVLYDEEHHPPCLLDRQDESRPATRRVGVPEIHDNVQRHVEVRREWHLLDSFCERLRSTGIWARVASSVPHPGVLAKVI